MRDCLPFSDSALAQLLTLASVTGPYLAANLAAFEPVCVHVRISGSMAESVEEAREVMRIEGLIVGRRIQAYDVVSGRRAGNRTGSRLRTIGFLWDSGNSLGATAEKRHYRIIRAFQAKVNVREQGRASQASPRERPIQCGAIFAQPRAKSAMGAVGLWRYLIKRREICAENNSLIVLRRQGEAERRYEEGNE